MHARRLRCTANLVLAQVFIFYFYFTVIFCLYCIELESIQHCGVVVVVVEVVDIWEEGNDETQTRLWPKDCASLTVWRTWTTILKRTKV